MINNVDAKRVKIIMAVIINVGVWYNILLRFCRIRRPYLNKKNIILNTVFEFHLYVK